MATDNTFDHITVHVWAPVNGTYWGISGCTCGWVGPRRTCIATAAGDELLHRNTATGVENPPTTRPVVLRR